MGSTDRVSQSSKKHTDQQFDIGKFISKDILRSIDYSAIIFTYDGVPSISIVSPQNKIKRVAPMNLNGNGICGRPIS